ncbi:MAG: glycerol kinase [Planctomycetes bacterium]|nr:glycerol kinase [Planctomycetota bacterium]
MEAKLLAIDAGTTGVTAVLFDGDLRPLGRAYREFPQVFPRPGWVEHEAADILSAVDGVVGEILAHPDAGGVELLGITNQRETVFALERKSGRPLGRGIVWQDRRTAERCLELREGGYGDAVHRQSGLLLDPYFSASKIEWLMKQDDQLARRTRNGEVVFATVDTLLIHHLSGGAVFSTDPTNACRTMLYDIEKRAWSPDLCELFGVPIDALATVNESTACVTYTDPGRTAGRRMSIHGVAGDQQSALFGQGCFEKGSFKATYGTGSFLLLNAGAERKDSQRGLVTTLAIGRSGESVYSLEGSVFICGAAVQWLRDSLGFIGDAAEIEALAGSVEDAGGVYFIPAFAGLGAPYWDAEARGALLGLTRGTEPAHIARAVLEAMAFQNAELIELFRAESGLAVERVLADGGAARNDLLMQIQSDLARATLVRFESVEATARGVAALAGLGAGLWSDPGEPMARCQTPEEVFTPKLEEAARQDRLAEWELAVRRVLSNTTA